MMKNNIRLFILDDDIPKDENLVESLAYTTRINQALLTQLITTGKWSGRESLKGLITEILDSENTKKGLIDTVGYTHPELCLSDIEDGFIPDVIIYDWEYNGEDNVKSVNWLIEILDLAPEAFVFVYSQVRDSIPAFLNKSTFDKYSHRFQLFLKGDHKNSIFTTEEFIIQYINSLLGNISQIKIQGINIDFNTNGYLNTTNDILYLEKIFGRKNLLNKLNDLGNVISNENIEKLIDELKGNLLFDEKNNLLITDDSILFIEKFKPQITFSYKEALKKYGLEAIKNVIDIGITKV